MTDLCVDCTIQSIMEPENKPNQNLTQTETDSEQKRQEAVARFKNLIEKPPTKEIWFKNKTVRNMGILLLIVLILGATAYELGIHSVINVPGVHQHIEVLPTFDNNPPMHTIKDENTGETYYESNPIIIKAGVNAVPATQEDITDLQNQTPPIYQPTPDGEHNPYISIIFSVDITNAESVQIIKSTFDTNRGNHNFPYFYADEWQISIKGNGILPLPLVEGAKKVTTSVVMDSANKSQISHIDLTYQLNDGREIKGFLNFESKNYIPTDVLNSIPSYVPSEDSNMDDLNLVKKFDLSQNPYIPLIQFSGSTSVGFSVGTGEVGGGLSPIFETKNGKLLYSSNAP